MIRKVLLVGCKEGPWVPAEGMRDTFLVVKCGPHTRILVHEVGRPLPHQVNCQGEHRMILTGFVRAQVVKGDAALVMVTLMGEEANAVQVA